MSDTEMTEGLIRQLEAISSNTQLPLERRLIDTAVWYHRNKEHLPREDALKRLDFLEKTFDIFLEMVAMTVERTQLLEGRGRSESLWLPAGITDAETGRRYG